MSFHTSRYRCYSKRRTQVFNEVVVIVDQRIFCGRRDRLHVEEPDDGHVSGEGVPARVTLLGKAPGSLRRAPVGSPREPLDRKPGPALDVTIPRFDNDYDRGNDEITRRSGRAHALCITCHRLRAHPVRLAAVADRGRGPASCCAAASLWSRTPSSRTE